MEEENAKKKDEQQINFLLTKGDLTEDEESILDKVREIEIIKKNNKKQADNIMKQQQKMAANRRRKYNNQFKQMMYDKNVPTQFLLQ